MKKLLTSLAAFTALTAAASAADLPRRAPPPVFTPVPVFTWTGFYFGFNAGYGLDASSNSNDGFVQTGANPLVQTPAGALVPVAVAAPGTVVTFNRNQNEGFSGGGQIGYNYQFTPGSGVVIGVEADAQYLDFGRNRNNAFINGAVAPGFTVTDPRGLSSLDYFGTVRGRLGYAFDRTLVYATGGFAYGSGGGRDFGQVNGASDDFQTGYAVGGGVEFAVTPNSFLSFLNFFNSSAVTFKIEGLYVNLDRGNHTNTGAFAVTGFGNTVAVPTSAVLLSGATNLRRDTEFAVVRAGVNYKFGTY